MKGKTIVIEGVDSAGKKTQAELLVNQLNKKGIKAELISFPSYDTPLGQVVADYLRGKYGSLEEVNAEAAALLYAADRYQKRKEIMNKIENGTTIVFDRYSQANYGHQAAKVPKEKRTAFIKWLKEVESRLPEAETIIFLDVPVEITFKLCSKREKKHTNRDLHEENIKHLRSSRKAYLEIAKKDKWIIIQCYTQENKMKKIEEINTEILNALKEKQVI